MKPAAIVVGLAVVSLTGCGSRSSQRQKAAPTIYILESGKTGWVKIVYNRADEAELPAQNGFVVARIGQDLKLFTRSRMNPSWDGSQFYYQAPGGKRVRLSSADNGSRLIWAQEKITDADGGHETFFVGKEQQLSGNLHSAWNGGFLAPPKDSGKTGKPEKPPDMGKVLTELPRQ